MTQNRLISEGIFWEGKQFAQTLFRPLRQAQAGNRPPKRRREADRMGRAAAAIPFGWDQDPAERRAELGCHGVTMDT